MMSTFIDVFQVLNRDKQNGFAMVHLGFIVKTIDRNYEDSIPLLQYGIATNAPGVIDGRFFFHLGDALYRTDRHEEVRGTPLPEFSFIQTYRMDSDWAKIKIVPSVRVDYYGSY